MCIRDSSYTEAWAKRFDGYGWHVQRGVDFNNSAAIYEAVMTAQSDPRPSIIGLKSIIGFGSPNKAGTSKVHGEALGEDELKATKAVSYTHLDVYKRQAPPIARIHRWAPPMSPSTATSATSRSRSS